jgi:hypothetical protein
MKLKPLSPRFSGTLPEPSVLSVPPRGEEYRFIDEDREAVENIIGRLGQFPC